MEQSKGVLRFGRTGNLETGINIGIVLMIMRPYVGEVHGHITPHILDMLEVPLFGQMHRLLNQFQALYQQGADFLRDAPAIVKPVEVTGKRG